MAQCLRVVDEDDTLAGISAFNENGTEGSRSSLIMYHKRLISINIPTRICCKGTHRPGYVVQNVLG